MTPVVLVTGVHEDSMAAVTVGLQFDLPAAAVVQHRLDVAGQRLTRLVSDVDGMVEHVHTDLDHACVSCALREDIIPTLERLGSSGRWASLVVHLPVAAEAAQVCRVLALHPDAAPHVEVAAVVTALDATRLHDDLLGDALLRDRGLHRADDDGRGVAETTAAMVEYADAVVLVGQPDVAGPDLVRALARPGAEVVPEAGDLDTARLVAGVHDHGQSERWVDEVRREPLPRWDTPHVWTLELSSERPFHPERLMAGIEAIGTGPRRSRGCFWLPTRPGTVCVWDGAGGQLSIGAEGPWGTEPPLTRIVVTGVDDDRDALRSVFERCLLSDTELAGRGAFWEVAADGFEPWLGPVRNAA